MNSMMIGHTSLLLDLILGLAGFCRHSHGGIGTDPAPHSPDRDCRAFFIRAR